jgi:ADP-ribose pyrophosphatase YjhB (NUDIX family)
MERKVVAGGIVLNSRGEVALVKNGPDFWGFPKGHVDEGEDHLAAAKREIEEETGLTKLELIAPLGVYERYRGTPDGGDDREELKIIEMFYFRTDQEELKPIDAWNPEAKWVTQEEVADMLTHHKDAEFFEKVRPLLQ